MISIRIVVLGLALAALAGCSGGGGSPPIAPGPPWEKFRHDLSNSGQGNGFVAPTPGAIPAAAGIIWAVSIDPTSSGSTEPTPAAISASPAIGINSTLYIGSEGGTLAAINPGDGSTLWKTSSCSVCPASNSTPTPGGQLGALISSPAVYTNGVHTNLFVGSMNGSLYTFEFDGGNFPACTVCFQPTDLPNGATAAIASSPAFTLNSVTAAVAGIFVGVTITDPSGATSGKLYALNTDGSVKWEYPRSGADPIGAISSSPAFGVGGTLFFTTDDGVLYALTPDGGFKWTAAFPAGGDVALAPSPLVNASTIITSSADGVVLALNPDGSPRWRVDVGDGFANSLAVGFVAGTPTATPTVAPVPTPVIGVASTTVVAVGNSGTVWLFDTNPGEPLPALPTPRATIAACPTPQPPRMQLCSSPALSGDSYIIVGSGDGTLHAISTADGSEPAGFPVALGPTPVPSSGVPAPTPQPIRSSPSVDTDGTIYVGSDDGHLYAVGLR